jgi:hypothetical protein
VIARAGAPDGMMRLLVALALLALPALGAAQIIVPRPVVPLPYYPVPVVPMPPAEQHGAIAYDRASGAFGYSFDFPGEREAAVSALQTCGTADCIVVVRFKSGCGALVDGPAGPAAATGATAREAEVKARLECTDPQCGVIAWACTK